MGRRRRWVALRILAVGLTAGLVAAWPATVAAHPLGNFTINHYAGLRVEVDRVILDVVIDQAEVPAFQARQDFDLDADGSVSDDEIDAGRVAACQALTSALSLTVGESTNAELRLVEAGLSFPPGVGGLTTMRLVCLFEAALDRPIDASPTRLSFSDGSFRERLGWREIVAVGSGVRLEAIDGDLRATGISDRLRRYPDDRLASPLSDETLTVDATAGGDVAAALDVPDAEPVPGAGPISTDAPSPGGSLPPIEVPGGVGAGELPSIFREADLTPIVLLVSLVTAAALGAGHALTPGHGKTLMAAYLVGTRGSARHALGLGAAVSVSHTAGILALAAIVVGGGRCPAARRRRPLGAGRRGRLDRAHRGLDAARRGRGAGRPTRRHGHDERARAWSARHGDARPRPRPRRMARHGHDHAPDPSRHRHHSHGGMTHSHLPPAGSTITWRSLFVLGLAGGLIPSTSALLILLGSIAAGRPAFGFVLVVAFGLGMAAVMGGIGLVLVLARDRVDRLPAGGSVTRLREAVPLVASVVVLGFGLILTAQALDRRRPRAPDRESALTARRGTRC